MSDAVIGLLMAEAIIAEIALFAWGRRLIERLGPAGLTACAAAGIGGALERDSAGATSAGARGDPVAARGDVRDAAPLGDAAAEPCAARTRRHGAGAALGFGHGCAVGLLMLLTGFLYPSSAGWRFWRWRQPAVSALLLVRPIMTLQ